MFYYVYIQKEVAVTSSWNTFLKPFSPGLWLAVAATCFGVAVFIELLFFLLHHVTAEPHVPSLGSCFLITFSIFCMQGQARLPASRSVRVVFMTCYLSAITLLAAYSAKLIASLTVQMTNLPFRDIEGLLNDGRYKFGMARGSAEYSIVEHSKDPTLHELSEQLKDPTIPHESLKGLQYVCEAQFAYMTTLDYAQANRRSLPCDIVVLPSFSFQVSVAIPLRQGSPYLGLFNHNIKRMRGSGLIKKLMDDTRPKPLPDSPVPLKQMSLQDMIPLLVSLVFGILISMVLAIIEKALAILYTLHL